MKVLTYMIANKRRWGLHDEQKDDGAILVLLCPILFLKREVLQTVKYQGLYFLKCRPLVDM
jgi:hypothetical protein